MHAAADRLTWGMELETFGLGVLGAANAVAAAVGGRVVFAGGYYQTHEVVMADGRKWSVVTDGSIRGSGGAEVVTPICKGLAGEDMENLQKVVRALRSAGAQVNDSCGLHVHVGAQALGAAGVRHLVLLWNRWEDHMMQASGGRPGRDVFSKKQDPAFVDAMVKAGRGVTVGDVNKAWYGRSYEYAPRTANDHYNQTRYRSLNLHAMFWHGTVEFRCWDATLHAGKVRAAVVASVCAAAVALDCADRNVSFTAHKPMPTGRGTAHLFEGFLTGWLKLSKRDNVFAHLTERHRAAGWYEGDKVNGREAA
jgi:hypothetical protein